MELKCRNINDAFRKLVSIFHVGHADGSGEPICVSRPSRNGKVLMIDEPVTVTYSHPRERVLFNQARDANPFFHVMESLWMLAGRNDVAPVAHYAKQMKEYSDDGKTLNGAYGYRWRRAKVSEEAGTLKQGDGPLTIDQLNLLVQHLKADPNSRRAVLQMWNVEDDLLKIGPAWEPADTAFLSKDVCCNLSVMFSLREEQYTIPGVRSFAPLYRKALDMTVANRSNDLVWGMLGANVVHFSFLQEYMAARLGAEVGRYHHFTNNLHVYVERPDWKPEAWLASDLDTTNRGIGYAPGSAWGPFPLVSDPVAFDREVQWIVEQYSGKEYTMGGAYSEPFLMNVAQPLFLAHQRYKIKEYEGAREAAESCKADDWRVAATEWLKRREKK